MKTFLRCVTGVFVGLMLLGVVHYTGDIEYLGGVLFMMKGV